MRIEIIQEPLPEEPNNVIQDYNCYLKKGNICKTQVWNGTQGYLHVGMWYVRQSAFIYLFIFPGGGGGGGRSTYNNDTITTWQR